MKIACLAPTYGRPAEVLARSVYCFMQQQYPLHERRLLLFDDCGNVCPQIDGIPIATTSMVSQMELLRANNWRVAVVSTPTRSNDLGTKYNQMLRMLDDWPEAYAVWDDDDLYLPNHLQNIAAALSGGTRYKWAHPLRVWSTYTGRPELESAAGRFHGSLALRADFCREVGGWIATRRADFDQQMLARCAAAGRPAPYDAATGPSYVFTWADSGATHCQGLMRSPEDETWWEANAKTNVPHVGPITPALGRHHADVMAHCMVANTRLTGGAR